jgi:Arc/MetJ family transcription regulator
MRTKIMIDDDLMAEALRLTAARTKREAGLGLRALIRMDKQARLKKYRGKLSWQGDLGEMLKD